jgi:hypothetical protein
LAPHPRRARLLVAVAAAVLAVGAIIAITRGGSGHKPSVKSGSAAGTADSWAQQTAGQGPGRFALPADLPASLGLRMKKGGPPVTVTGTVRLAPGGTPVADAEVAFMSDLGENTAISDGSGRYTIKIASGIRWKVHARSEKAVGYPEAIEPAADVVRDLEIHPTAAIKGKVVDAREGRGAWRQRVESRSTPPIAACSRRRWACRRSPTAAAGSKLTAVPATSRSAAPRAWPGRGHAGGGRAQRHRRDRHHAGRSGDAQRAGSSTATASSVGGIRCSPRRSSRSAGRSKQQFDSADDGSFTAHPGRHRPHRGPQERRPVAGGRRAAPAAPPSTAWC